MDYSSWHGSCKYNSNTCWDDRNRNYRIFTGKYHENNRKEAFGMERTRGIKDKTIIRCENVTKEFSSGGEINKVIGGIDLEVHENEFLVLIGPGQCGKTTLINLIAGLDTPTKGNIYVNDKL